MVSLNPDDPMVGLVRILDLLAVTNLNGIRKAADGGNAEKDESFSLGVHGGIVE